MEENPAEQQTKMEKKGVRACFKRGWRAVKHTFSRSSKNKVMPFSSDPDPDPSEPQPGPSGQTRLRVFEPVVRQDQADSLPQQDPPGLEQTSPEQQPKEKKKKKKGVCAFFKRWQVMKHSRNNKVDPSDPRPAPEEPAERPQEQETKEEKETHFMRHFDVPHEAEHQAYWKFRQDPKAYDYIPPDTFPALWKWTQTFLEELDTYKRFSSLYVVGKRCLGKGHQGIVYEGMRRSDGLKVAIKFSHCYMTQDHYVKIPGYDIPLYTEVAFNLLLHQPTKCPNIIQLLDSFEENSVRITVFEYQRHYTSLQNYLQHNILTENQARDIMRQAVSAAAHCLQRNVCHASLDTKNTLINHQTMELKLIDFGNCWFASSYGEPFLKYCGDQNANERMLNGLGEILKEMSRDDMFFQDGNYVPASKECLDVLNLCTDEHAPTCNRIWMEDLLNHEWFKQT